MLKAGVVNPLTLFSTGFYMRKTAVARYSTQRQCRHFLGRLLAFSAVYVWPFFVFPAGKAVLFAVVPSGAISFCSMLSSQVNHLTDTNLGR
jgi:hypothetical protein